jgi:hypothetical protein
MVNFVVFRLERMYCGRNESSLVRLLSSSQTGVRPKSTRILKTTCLLIADPIHSEANSSAVRLPGGDRTLELEHSRPTRFRAL